MDSSNGAISKDALHDWVEAETRALDVVASWETLCDVYRTLEFSDRISDAMRMEEFKWIIAEMNKHLSRSRKKLMACGDSQSMMEVLANLQSPTEAKVTSRMDLTYHKLRQMWVHRMMMQLETMELEKMQEKENADGRDDFWND